ncbi:hypothetical protein D0Y65_020629 [Glycine soja]|uniref:Uncharacterized protein n=1 Tax=Glycine soja TaxID=3848 RepID=A0A445JF08_GLYSO|nr:hypothetical protein D0Y65_020629 [Glycine soja]
MKLKDPFNTSSRRDADPIPVTEDYYVTVPFDDEGQLNSLDVNFLFMSSSLNNTHDIRRKKEWSFTGIFGHSFCDERSCHCPGGIRFEWTGKDLLDLSTSEYVRSRPHLVIPEEDHADATMAGTLSPTNQNPEDQPITATDQTSGELIDAPFVTAFDMEIEHISNVAVTPPPTVPAHNVVEDDYMSADKRNDLTMKTLDLAASSGAHRSENMQTPAERMQTSDSDTPQLINSTDVLKTKKLVCVQQEQSYGDISLELATMPSNAQVGFLAQNGNAVECV